MINLGSSIANQTLADNRKFQMWIKETTNSTSVNDLADQLLKKGYDYGKFWVSSQV